MTLSGKQFAALQAGLLSAFPSPAALTQLMRVQFDLNLAAIAGGENYSEVVFNLIVWAEAQGRIDELIDKALADRPGNPDLRLAATQVRSGTGPTQPYARTVGTAIGSPPDRTMLRHVLVDQFNLEELRTLCFDLGVDYDKLPGEGKEAKARELIEYVSRRGEVDPLVSAIRRERGNVV